MQQIPSREPEISSARQEILHILWNPSVNHLICKCPPLVQISSHVWIDLAQFCFLKIHFNIIFQSPPRSFTLSLSVNLPTKNLYVLLLSLIQATRAAHLILLDLITQTIIGKQ